MYVDGHMHIVSPRQRLNRTANTATVYTSHTHCMTGVQYGCTVEFATTNGAIYTMVEWLQVNIATGSLTEGQY